MRSFHIVVVGISVLLPALCPGQTKCPWINEATAGGILGGAVTARVTLTKQGSGVCEFSGHEREMPDELRISVQTMTDIPKQFVSYLAQCPPKSAPLPAIGNEAVICTVTVKGRKYEERVVGRVRDQAFVVAVSSSRRGRSVDDRSDASRKGEARR
jgi:hypothetical protein